MRYSTKQVNDSGIFTIFEGGGWGEGRHNFCEIWREVRASLPFLGGGIVYYFSLRDSFSAHHPDNYCTVPYTDLSIEF